MYGAKVVRHPVHVVLERASDIRRELCRAVSSSLRSTSNRKEERSAHEHADLRIVRDSFGDFRPRRLEVLDAALIRTVGDVPAGTEQVLTQSSSTGRRAGLA